MNRYINSLKYGFGLLAIITGALATFDNGLEPAIRYVVIYSSILVISMVLIHSVYMDVDNTNSFDKVKNEQ